MSKQKNNNFIKKLLWLILFFSFFGISFWFLFFSNYTEIKEIQVKSNKIERKSIEEIFYNFQKEKYFNFISKNNFFLFPQKTFKNKIKNQFELVREVNFENSFPGIFRVEVTEREAIVVWCSQDQCFLMDEQGVIFREITENEKEESFGEYLIVRDDSMRRGALGDKIEDGQLTVFINNTKDKLKEELELKIEREITTPSLLSQEIRIKTDEGWQLYLDTRQNIEEQISLLKEVLEGSIENKDKLEYVDLRVEGKVIYKTK
jgi:cell division septal protein FtsQ